MNTISDKSHSIGIGDLKKNMVTTPIMITISKNAIDLIIIFPMVLHRCLLLNRFH